MSESRLKLLGRYDAWHGAAWRARLDPDGADRPVLVLFGPPVAGSDPAVRARERSAGLLGLRHPGVLELIDVLPYENRIAWVHAPFEGLGLGAPGVATGAIPVRCVVEIVARTAEILLDLSPGLRHPGPEPCDLLVSAAGRLVLSGFTGPTRRGASLHAPNGTRGDAAQVYRLGVLLAHLLAGAPPGQALGRDAHTALVRDVLARTLSARPKLPERVGEWLRGMLAWSPGDRPALSAVPGGLRTTVAGEAPSLDTWAPDAIPDLVATAEADARRIREELPPVLPVDDPATIPGPTAGITPEEPLEDEPTQEAEYVPPPPDAHPHLPRTLSPTTIPVRVGPPAPLARRPRLPDGFLEADDGASTGSVPRASRRPLLHAVAIALGALMAVLVVLNLLLDRTVPQRPPLPEPSIAEALGTVGSGEERFDVTFAVRGGEPFTVACPGVPVTRGTDVAVVSGTHAGVCTVTGVFEGAPVEVRVDVTGPRTIRCFQTRQPICF